MSDEPSDAERYPTLTEAGRKLLEFMREHPSAPVFRNESGNRLTAEDLCALEEYDRRLGAPPSSGVEPQWVGELVADVFAQVPYYRSLGIAPKRLEDVPSVSRAELAADIARFVPHSVSTERLINFQTTGTTGHRMLIPSHPQVAGR